MLACSQFAEETAENVGSGGAVILACAGLGQVVAAGAPVLRIAQDGVRDVVFSVPDVNLPRIRQQLNANTAMRVEARDRDQKTLLAEGRVSSTDNAIDTTTGTISSMALASKIGLANCGMPTQAAFITPDRSSGLPRPRPLVSTA